MTPHTWILYDGRAASGDTDSAQMLEAFTRRREIRKGIDFWRGQDAVLFEYDMVDNVATNERMVGHVREGFALLRRCTKGNWNG